MKRNIARVISVSTLLIVLTASAEVVGPSATNVAWAAPDATAGHEQALRRKVVCRVMGPEEWYLVTGQTSEYGGTLCVR